MTGSFRQLIDSDIEIVDEGLKQLLAETLGLERAAVAAFEENTELFGALPEFDSMAVAHLLTAMEERLGIEIEDDAVEAEDFMTFGRLTAMARRLALG